MGTFAPEVFEDLHDRAVSRLAAGCGADDQHIEEELFNDLRKQKQVLARPFAFRGREDTVDLAALARHVSSEHPRLASEPLVRVVDDVSKTLRLHQHDSCVLVEHALGATASIAELQRKCAALFYRECHFVALCLHDMAQGLGQKPPHRCSVAFFGMLGGPAFIKALFEALGLLLRDLATERNGDQMFLVHAGAMIQLLVETTLAYFFTFKPLADEAEQVIALLPHVVTSQHAPLGQTFTVSDLDLVLREEHVDIGTKLCLALLCMIYPPLGDGQLDISRIPEDIEPASLHLQDLAAAADATGPLASSALDAKIRTGSYWNEDNPLGQFLCFAINGVLLEDEKALRNGLIHWNTLSFILHDILLSVSVVGESCTGRIVLKCVHELLSQAFLPVGRRWMAIRKLEAQAVNYRMLAPDALQILVLQTLNRMCRVHPAACETFRDIALHCTDTFHLATHCFLANPGSPEPMSDIAASRNSLSRAPWFGVSTRPASAASLSSAPAMARHNSTALYAEILGLLASICARGSLHCTRLVCQKLVSHSNQWFNWGFLMDALAQAGKAPLVQPSPDAVVPKAIPVIVSLCHLVSAVCSTRLWVSQPPPQTSIQALQANFTASTLPSENFATLMIELLSAHPEPAVKAACLGALAHCDLSNAAAKTAFSALSATLPTLLVGISDVRGCCHGALAIELLACGVQLVQSVPLSKGRYSLDLSPLTHIVVNHLLTKVLTDTLHASNACRYWRLASLSLRWLRLVLRGPLPLGASSALNVALTHLYADSDSVATEVAMCTSVGNATSYVIRCLLTLDSPVFSQLMYLLLLRGHGADGVHDRRQGGASQAFMEQTVQVGLDILRVLFQRDVLFRRLYAQHAADRAAGPGTRDLHAGDLLLTHRLLFAEFAFTYPPVADDISGGSKTLSPFSGRRLWQNAAATPCVAGGAGGRRPNPSNFALLMSFVGARGNPEICRLASFIFMQCALREPSLVLRTLQLEPWRLQGLCADLHHRIAQPEEDDALCVAASLAAPLGRWDSHAEAQFVFEAVEMDLPSDFLLDVVSFRTGLPVCHAVDAVCQLADDAVVQAADLLSWAHCSGGGAALPGGGAGDGGRGGSGAGGASADTWCFMMGYLRGVETPSEWLGAGAADVAGEAWARAWAACLCKGGDPSPSSPGASALLSSAPPPRPVLATMPCRLLALRSLALLLSGAGPKGEASTAPKLAQVLLGLDPDAADATGSVDVHLARSGQPLLLDAVMELLEHPPPLLSQSESSGLSKPFEYEALRPHGEDRGLLQAVEQHSTYEAALGIILSLLVTPYVRDVALRYVCYSWPSRYQVLRSLLSTQWLAVPLPLLRVLLVETVLMLQVASWEMRALQPAGLIPHPEVESLNIANHQRLEMQQAVASYLKEVVHSFCTSNDAGASVQGTPPFLVAAALKLADACDAVQQHDDGSVPQPLNGQLAQAVLQTSSCLCLAPSHTGCLTLCLGLHDPFLCFCLLMVGRQQPWQYSTNSPDTQVMDAAHHRQFGRFVGMGNRSVCTSFLARAVWHALGLFFSAALYHLDHGLCPGRFGADPRDHCVRALLESLMPALASHALSHSSAGRLELVSTLTTSLIVAMQRAAAPAPLAFVRGLYVLLHGLALHPAGTQEVKQHAHQSLLLLVQRMLPDVGSSSSGDAVLGDLAQLRQLINSVLDVACVAVDTSSESESDCSSIALTLLIALLSRVPVRELGELFGGCDIWMKLFGLLALRPNPSAGVSQHSSSAPPAPQVAQTMSLMAVLCRSPPLAAWCFESGCLSAVLESSGFLLRSASAHLSSAGSRALDSAHVAAMLAVLRVLVAVATSLPAQQLALLSIVAWLERHQRLLTDLVQWVTCLPLVTAVEPGPIESNTTVHGGVQAASAVAAAAGRVGGLAQCDPMRPQVLLCAADADNQVPDSRPLGRAAAPPSSTLPCGSHRRLSSMVSCAGSQGPAVGLEVAEDAAASRCYSCVAALVELWALLQGSPAGGDLSRRLQHLEPAFSDVIGPLLAHMTVVVAPDHGTAGFEQPPHCVFPSRDQTVGGSGPLASNLDIMGRRQPTLRPYPSEFLRLSICLHVLHAWRRDSVSQLLAGSMGCPNLSSSSSLSYGHAESSISPAGRCVQQNLVQIWSRVGVLCSTFVHACAGLLSVKLAEGVEPAADSSAFSAQPALLYGGSCGQYGLLRDVVEVSLHLLHTHLQVLASVGDLASGFASLFSAGAGGAAGAPAPAFGTPRLALVVQYLRAARHLSLAAGGALMPVPLRGGRTAMASGGHNPLPRKVFDLRFAACLAEQVEELLLELQGF